MGEQEQEEEEELPDEQVVKLNEMLKTSHGNAIRLSGGRKH